VKTLLWLDIKRFPEFQDEPKPANTDFGTENRRKSENLQCVCLKKSHYHSTVLLNIFVETFFFFNSFLMNRKITKEQQEEEFI